MIITLPMQMEFARLQREKAEREAAATPERSVMDAFRWDLKSQSSFGYSMEYVDALRRWQAEEPELQNESVNKMIRRVEVLVD